MTKQEWISVETRLPPHDMQVLLLTEDDPFWRVTVGYRDHDEDDGAFWVIPDSVLRGHEVTHWMPLPEPPE